MPGIYTFCARDIDRQIRHKLYKYDINDDDEAKASGEDRGYVVFW